MLTEWLSSLDPNSVDIDNDHKRIDALVDDAMDLLERDDSAVQANRRLHEVLFLFDHHFRTERSLMKLSGFPDYARHNAAHLKFYREFETILRISGFSHDCLRTVALFVRNFCDQHQKNADRPLVRFLRTTPELMPAYCREAIKNAVLEVHQALA